MIYDKTMTVLQLGAGKSPTSRKLEKISRYYYAEKSVYASRFFAGKQVGVQIARLVSCPRTPFDKPIEADQYCVLEDGQVYRIEQAQREHDNDGMPCTTLSLAEPEGKYEIFQD